MLPSLALAAEPELRLHPKVRELASMKASPYVKLADGSALGVVGNTAYVTRDGASYSATYPLADEAKFKVSNERVLVRTDKGTILMAYMNLNERKWGWDKQKNEPIPDAQLPVWVVRSEDEGKTWRHPVKIHDGYCGAIRSMIQLRSGRVVLVSQKLVHESPRHITQTYWSDDDGRSWRAGNMLDIGGRGHHDGLVEATVAELKDGRVWMLLRSNHDKFWEAFSDDGRYWYVLRPSRIEASSSPGYLLRLKSGRLMLAWNRLYPEGATTYESRGKDYSERAASWHREELSVAISEDEGQNWSKPVVVAKQAKKWLSYPWLYEHTPGEIWITTMQGNLRVAAREQDLVR